MTRDIGLRPAPRAEPAERRDARGEGGRHAVLSKGGDLPRIPPRTVTLGPRSENNFYQVLSGLNEGERVVTSGQFMLDSESQLREAIQKMLQPGKAVTTNEHAGHVAPSTNVTSTLGGNSLTSAIGL